MTARVLTPRRTLAAAAGALLALAAPAAGASAQPQVLEATCVGTQEVGYSPGIVLLTERQTTVTGSTTYDCLSADVESGTSGFSVSDSRSCTSVTPSGAAETIRWDDGSESVLTMSSAVVSVGGTTVVTKNGTVTDGRFEGALALATITGPTVSGLLDCLTPGGMTHTSEAVVLEITSIP
ncbi:hypothetical protein ACH436_14905 [Isoptericola sp. NPDC019693]|uniref:hypothetical protein n=1 Tax=Isoptericola sp. NPDC019693 TaxID=3364009 RepID=UPI0037A8DEA6